MPGKFIVVGDRVLIEPNQGEQQTDSGLVLPASVLEREKVGSGTVIKVGPGYVTPNPDYSEGENWRAQGESVRYLPLQAQPGDQALFLKKGAIEITYDGKEYLILHHSEILALVRPGQDDLLDGIKDILSSE